MEEKRLKIFSHLFENLLHFEKLYVTMNWYLSYVLGGVVTLKHPYNPPEMIVVDFDVEEVLGLSGQYGSEIETPLIPLTPIP